MKSSFVWPAALQIRNAISGLVGTTARSAVFVGAFAFLIALSAGTAPAFVYDAAMYWNGAQAIVGGGDVAVAGGLGLRGVLSSLVYLPAAAFDTIAGGGAAQLAVLIQNSALIALLGAVVLPRIIALLVVPRLWQIWAAGLAVACLLRSFAPFPLMDIWAVAFVLLGLLLVMSQSKLLTLLGGVAFACALNLRPAYLVPIALMAIVWTVFRWRMLLWPLLGIIAGFIPQIVFNLRAFSVALPWPVDTFRITQIQTQYASFVVRYDTRAFDSATDPRLFSCSPDMAAIVSGGPPQSTQELARLFLANPFESVPFAIQKIAASLQWSFATPYSNATPGELGVIGFVVIAISVLGLVGLVRNAVQRDGSLSRSGTLVLLALALGVAGTLVMSAPEARFALPVVLLGVVGSIVWVAALTTPMKRLPVTEWLWLGSAVLALALTLVAAQAGLAHPAPPGDVTAESCVQP